ncbi:hypothetical protein F4679DRAFT_174674 [Xylaria curta]|nr:hypothetical protein F4679DRAFT_174674 [Xylaria curta]
MMGEPNKIENTTEDSTDQNLSPLLRLYSDNKAKWDDESNSDNISGNSKRLVKKIGNRALVPESWELAIEDEADSEHISKKSKGERRRIRQRERRQKQRHDEWKIKAEAERDARQTMPDLPLELPRSDTDQLKRAKRQRLSPKERTITFCINLFKYDTRPADWDLVCIQPGEYTVFPFRQVVLPLSRLSALVWETEYKARRIGCLVGKGLREVETILIEKERELLFYERHMRNKDLLSRNWSKYSGKFKNLPLDLVIKVLYYSQLVLRRVIAQLEIQKWELLCMQRYRKSSEMAGPAETIPN